MNEVKYTKLSELVGNVFTVEKAYGYQWKKWDNDTRRMLTSERYEPGFKKVYTLDTDRGKLDLGAGQLGNLLESTYKNGAADINGKTFEVKSNGKSGMEVRYFLNLVASSAATATDDGYEW